jgi:glycopeptide antibiotics resistance protein
MIDHLWQFLVHVPGMLAMGWHGGLGTFNGVVLYTLLGLPFVALLVLMLPRALPTVGITYGTLPWLWMTLMPGDEPGRAHGRTSLVPFMDLISMGALGIVGNLLVFAALGFFAPMRVTALTSIRRVLVLAASCSTLIEVAQYVLRLDRVSSVDDVLLNTAGAGLAALLSRRWWLKKPVLHEPGRGRTESFVQPSGHGKLR